MLLEIWQQPKGVDEAFVLVWGLMLMWDIVFTLHCVHNLQAIFRVEQGVCLAYIAKRQIALNLASFDQTLFDKRLSQCQTPNALH